MLLGITPGEQQANAAIQEARRALQQGVSDTEVLARAKVHASFAGQMRTNLVAMLDGIGLAKALGIHSCASLWGRNSNLVQFASALRFPVFSDSKNYSGRSPAITRSAVLREQLQLFTAPELAQIPNALVFPLGPAVAEACAWLVKEGLLDEERVAAGLPHPSPASNERIAFFLGRKEERDLSRQVVPEKIIEGRKAVMEVVARWAAENAGRKEE
ncbi:hypothetical protein [Roseobacter sp. HKCCA0434]|uniref:hypothetical protein n=1 Tax=Roseobacter sp. HKCCA0434 TaxID=3079297 RepID=UPI002905AA7B|nr:hypothetical protein [Roseobacter sp. HKCCA0434]